MRVATLSEMLEVLIRLGEATGMEEHAHELRGELEGRLATVRAAVAAASSPRVIALERLDPPRVAGYWIPEMISIAGGEDVAGDPGLDPPEVGWGELESLRADVVVAMPDGSLADSRAQAMEHWELIAGLGAGRVFAVDSEAAFTQPGPRLVDGVELLAHLLHPERVPAGQRWLRATAGAGEQTIVAISQWYSGDGDRADEGDHGNGDHHHVLGDAVVGAEPAFLAGDDRKGAQGAAHEAAQMSAGADVVAGEGKDQVEDDQEADLTRDLVHATTPGDHESGSR
jgi:hypothetical protein